MKLLFYVLGLGAIVGCITIQVPVDNSGKPMAVKKAVTVEIHGHRGTRGTRPENTLPSFQEAAWIGVDVLELDLHLTKDGVLVVWHDWALSPEKCLGPGRTPLKAPVAIASLNAAELKHYDCGALKQEKFPEQILQPGTSPLVFENLLTWVKKEHPKIGLNIETKMDMPVAKENPDPVLFADKVIDLLEKYELVSNSVLQSFDFRTLTAAKIRNPLLHLSCLFENKPENTEFWTLTKKVGATIASPNLELINPNAVAKAHELGIKVIPWTANTPADWERLVASRVDGIITDYPKKLIDWRAN